MLGGCHCAAGEPKAIVAAFNALAALGGFLLCAGVEVAATGLGQPFAGADGVAAFAVSVVLVPVAGASESSIGQFRNRVFFAAASRLDDELCAVRA